MWTRYLRNTIIAGVFLLPVLPLIVVNDLFFPFITGKNFFFRILVEILLALWVILMVRDSRYRLKRSGIALSGGVFLLVITIADLFGENFFKSFWSNFERMEGLLTLFHLGAYFVVASTVLQTEKLWRWFWGTSLGVSAIVCGYAFLQLAGELEIHQGGDRLDATLGNATYLAIYNLFHVFIALLLAVKSRTALGRVAFGVLAALNALVLVYTATRGAVLGLMGGLLLAAVLVALFERRYVVFRRVALGGVGILVALVVLFIAVKDTSYVQHHNALSRIASISLSEGSTRFAIWNIALQGVKEKPILGWGQENFNIVFNKYYDSKLYTQEPWFDHVHNIVLDWLIAGGIAGAVAYFAIVLSVLWYLWHPRYREVFSVGERSIITGLLAGYFFHNLFVFDNVVSYFLYVSLLAYVYSQVHGVPLKSQKGVPQTAGWIAGASLERIVIAFSAVALVGSFYFLNVRGIATATTLIEALTYAQQGGKQSEQMLDAFAHAAAYNAVGSQEVAEQTVFTAIALAGRSDVPQEVQQRLFALGKSAMEEELSRGADDARLRLFYASLLSRYGQFSSALAEIQRAQQLSPEKPVIAFELGNVQLAQGNVAGALAAFKGVHEDLPEYDDAQVLYAVAAVYAGDLTLAESILKTTEPEGRALLTHDDRLLNAFIAVKRFDVVKTIWEMRVAENPQNASAYLSLAGAYLELNNGAAAIENIRKAIELDGKYKEQGEVLIRSIETAAASTTAEIE